MQIQPFIGNVPKTRLYIYGRADAIGNTCTLKSRVRTSCIVYFLCLNNKAEDGQMGRPVRYF